MKKHKIEICEYDETFKNVSERYIIYSQEIFKHRNYAIGNCIIWKSKN